MGLGRVGSSGVSRGGARVPEYVQKPTVTRVERDLKGARTVTKVHTPVKSLLMYRDSKGSEYTSKKTGNQK